MFGFGKYPLKVLSRLTVAGTLVSTAQAELQLDGCTVPAMATLPADLAAHGKSEFDRTARLVGYG